MRKFTFILLCLLFFYSIYAKEVTLETARLIATNLYYERINDFSKLEYQEIKFTKDSGIIADNFSPGTAISAVSFVLLMLFGLYKIKK